MRTTLRGGRNCLRRSQGMQVLATWRTERTRRLGIVEVVPVSRVAVAPEPVAPAVPVEPLVALVEGSAGAEFVGVERAPSTSTLVFRYFPKSS